MRQISERLGRRIVALRKDAGLTQDQLSELSGLSAKYIGQIERGEVNATAQALEQIGHALGLELHQLVDCGHEDSLEAMRADLLEYISKCSEEKLRLAYRLVGTLR